MSKSLSDKSELEEAREIMLSIAAPEHAQRALNKLSMKLPEWSYRHIKAVFYLEARTAVSSGQMKQLKRAAKLNNLELEATDEVRQLRDRLERLERLLLSSDQDFHSENIEALRFQARGLGGKAGGLDGTPISRSIQGNAKAK